MGSVHCSRHDCRIKNCTDNILADYNGDIWDYIPECMQVFFDEFLVYSKMVAHLEHLTWLFTKVPNGVFLVHNSCVIFRPMVVFGDRLIT